MFLRYLQRMILGLLPVWMMATSLSFARSSPQVLSSDCATYKNVPLPAEANGIAAPTTFPTCGAYRSYLGIGRKVDYEEARSCAWRERSAQLVGLAQNPRQPTAWFVGGSLILADIYFNGDGVKRNVPLAMKLACESSAGMVDLAFPDVLKAMDQPSHKRFEFCDYGNSTFEMNFCGWYETEVDDDRDARFYRSLKRGMNAERRVAFEKLLVAERAYVDVHASEVYQGGTIRALRTMGSQEILHELFRTEIVHFERKQWPPLSAAQIDSAERLLRREYDVKMRQLEERPKGDFDGEVVHANELARVEGVWNGYRDAWAGFARLRYEGHSDAIVAKIEFDRYRLLKTIGDYD